MASPFNPFAGRGQSAGEASTSGRGRGSTRGSTRGGTDRGDRDSVRGRGRGRGIRGRGADGTTISRGRGAGAAARGASHAASSISTSSMTANVASSPFAQLNQPSQLNPPTNVFAQQLARSKSPMAPGASMRGGAAARNNTFNPGAPQHVSRQSPTVNGHAPSTKPTSADHITMSGSYQDRYEQVSQFPLI